MNLQVSMHSDLPIYEQLKNQIRHAILKKNMTEGDQLPSVRVLSKDLSIGIITVKRAYDDLVGEGFLISQMGKGYFVNRVDITLFKSVYQTKIKMQMQEIHSLAEDVGMSLEELITLLSQTKEKV